MCLLFCVFIYFFFDAICFKALEMGKVLEISWLVFYCSVYEIKHIDPFISDTNLVKLSSLLGAFKFVIMKVNLEMMCLDSFI